MAEPMEQSFKSRFVNTDNITPPQTMQELVNRLREVFEDDHVNVDYVKALMNSYTVKKSDWAAYAKYDEYR